MPPDAAWPAVFHPLVAEWFGQRLGAPAPAQREAWPRIAAGEHVLLLAPTGAGKTLAAFLYALNQLVTGAWPPGQTSVLYVSPLKALNNDIQRNLLRPLVELRGLFGGRGAAFPEIRVATRSGDTPAAERRRLLARPPEILITTPESLNLLLSTRPGQQALRTIRTVILDEIHAVIDTKRGTHLITAVERLARLAGEFQRLALSATVTDPAVVARFVGGYQLVSVAAGERPGQPDAAGARRGWASAGSTYRPRPVAIVEPSADHPVDLEVLPIPAASAAEEALVAQVGAIIAAHRATLIFVNSRRRCESLAAALNSGRPEPLVYAHHGSLAREIRLAVEARLKQGQLRGIVATSSLELGIDVGSIDAVVLLQCPPTVASALQRIGRSGHAVDRRSLGLLVPTHGHDLLELTVLAQAAATRAIETSAPVQAPLDVLAQVLVSMTATEVWDLDELYAWVRASAPYHELTPAAFDLVLEMLAGRYGSARLRSLRPRVSLDRLHGTVTATRGAVQALFSEGGTIPDRGYYELREIESQARIGELDEEFVWENGVGSRFVFGSQRWQVERVTHNEVLVSRWRGAAEVPFWKGNQLDRGFHLASRIGAFLEAAEGWLEAGELRARLAREYRLSPAAAEQLGAYLASQRRATGQPLPHRHHLLVEHIRSGPQGAPGHQVFLHAPWGRRAIRPWGLALAAAWRHRHGYEPEVFACNHGLGLVLRDPVPAGELLRLVTPATLLPLLRDSLEGSAFFGAVFRECAGRALLIGRQRRGQRMPLWLSRIRSVELLEAVSRFDDFPILLEAWRACLQDHFDTTALTQMLDEVHTGQVRTGECATERGSPFALTDTWYQVNEYMYRDDRPRSRGATPLRASLLDEVVATPGLRPRLSRELVTAFEQKAQRLAPGYAPASARELVDWVKERVLVPWAEWVALVRCHDASLEAEEALRQLEADLAVLPGLAHQTGRPQSGPRLVCAREQLAAVQAALGAPGAAAPPAHSPAAAGAATWLAQWLRAYGPLPVSAVPGMLGLDPGLWARCVAELTHTGEVLIGALMEDSDAEYVCDAANFAALLRLARSRRRVEVAPRPAGHLALLLATLQGVARPPQPERPPQPRQAHQLRPPDPEPEESATQALEERLAQLAGLPLPAEMWERDVLPARVPGYRPQWLDHLLLQGELTWYGAGPRRIAFAAAEQADLLPRTQAAAAEPDSASPAAAESVAPARLVSLLESGGARYDFSALCRASGVRPSALLATLWRAVWQGQISSDSFAAVRRGLQTDFAWDASDQPPARLAWRRTSTLRRRRAPPPPQVPGYWYRREVPPPWEDAVEAAEAAKEQVRLLLDRYGILCRQLLEREEPDYGWSAVFRPLRWMELSGEVVAGQFLAGVPGPQFTTPANLQLLEQLDLEAVYWLAATDPACVAGLGLGEQAAALPPRRPGVHLVYHGTALVLVSQRHGRVLHFGVPPAHPALGRYLILLDHLMCRRVDPVRLLVIDQINGAPAAASPYVPALQERFAVRLEGSQVVVLRDG